MIDIHTKFVTLIGTPLDQSFAARMQNRAYESADINMKYFYTETDDTHLAEIITGLRYMPSFCGAAITKPNKVKILPLLDELDSLCAKMGACNTVVKTTDGKLRGYNTDGIGFYRSITEEAGIDPKGKKVFCFGAGGAGRAICSVLAYYGVEKIYVTSRTEYSRNALVDDINHNFASVAESVENGNWGKIQECSILINASGIGMGMTEGQSPLPERYILSHQFCFDACYNPDKTAFLISAERKGCQILNGLGMSLYQGAAQIELWQQDKKAPVEEMRQELISILEEKSWKENHKNSTMFRKV